ncbi:MAG: hypothetical protein J1G01_06375 [Clostridiales bacterium]|nr:hypothetical protein [Clostridiales bacterium]
MSGGEIALLVGVLVAFAVAVGIIIRNKLKGKSCCDCGGTCGTEKGSKPTCDGCCSHCIADAKNKDGHNK